MIRDGMELKAKFYRPQTLDQAYLRFDNACRSMRLACDTYFSDRRRKVVSSSNVEIESELKATFTINHILDRNDKYISGLEIPQEYNNIRFSAFLVSKGSGDIPRKFSELKVESYPFGIVDEKWLEHYVDKHLKIYLRRLACEILLPLNPETALDDFCDAERTKSYKGR